MTVGRFIEIGGLSSLGSGRRVNRAELELRQKEIGIFWKSW